jgi:uncharacterized protein (TIGR01244 family)
MDLRQLSPKLAVSPQIAVEDLPELAEAGFKVLIINRPDQEVGPDLDHEIVAAAAVTAGMKVHYLPFFPGEVTPQLITDFAEATAGMGPAIAYCRSGHRSTVLWALSQAGKRSEAEILETASNAGYDLTPVLPLIQSLANRKG